MTPSDLDAILAQLAEGHWPRPTAALGRAIVERIAGLEAALAESEADRADLRAAFIKHRTATHIVAPKFCHICRESDAVLAKTITLTYLARGIQQSAPAAGEE
jgi:hypothetical protein